MLPADVLSMMMFIGISCMDAVFSSTKTASVLREQPEPVSRFIAEMPKGRAAFPSPSRFEVTFSAAARIAGLSRGTSGISRPRTGRTPRHTLSTSPALSATRISPLQNIIAAATVIHSETASPAERAAASAMTSVSPKKTE